MKYFKIFNMDSDVNFFERSQKVQLKIEKINKRTVAKKVK